MNAFSSLFGLALAVIFSPAAGRAQFAPIADAIPVSGEPAFQINYIFPQPVVLPGGDPSFDVSDHVEGFQFPPDFTPLPGGDPSSDSASLLDYKSSAPFGPAHFLATVADARGRSLGTLKLNVSASGAFTSVLRIGKKAYPFRGTLDTNGSYGRVLTPRGATRVVINMQVANGHVFAAITKGRVSLGAQL